ncbi:MAG TPA: hypothetical protein PLD95_02010 [bacterium]|jgi:hypothetical protein|nr:hypothetical protein [bacterium]HOG38223.1 hypothetical protein [bacterium]HQI03187.1 hypothetical protein [bacterium]
MQKELPQIIKDVGFDFSWDEGKVWKLDEPISEMDIKELEWHFDIPFWCENGDYNLTPGVVINNPKKHKKEYERIMLCDLKYPLDIMENNGKWLLLDGLHRLTKAYIQGNKTVVVRKIPRERIPEILH